MTEEEYPIHPTLDSLIQRFKKFSTEGFPRGIPQPAVNWREILQGLTRYESTVVPQVYEYLTGQKADLSNLSCPEALKLNMQGFKLSSVEESDFLNKLIGYRNQIDALVFALEDCVNELGNPCTKFRTEAAEAFLRANKK